MHTITLRDGKTFQAPPSDTILNNALLANIQLEHSCKNGRCGACKTHIQGTSTVIQDELALSPEEMAQGFGLTCCRTAQSDLCLDIEDLPELQGFTVKMIPCRIDTLRRLTPQVLEVVLRTPPNNALRFLAGQHISLTSPTGITRSYSLANAPRDDGKLVLHIKQVPDGAFSQYWFEHAEPNDLLRLKGPLGSFFLRQQNPAIKHLVFLATGTGIAPIQAMLEYIEQHNQLGTRFETIRVYFGCRTNHEVYWAPSLFLKEHPAFHFSPCLSRPSEPSGAGVERGYVQNILAQHLAQQALPLDQTAIYACGSSPMINSAKACLIKLRHPQHLFYADAFVSTTI